MGAHHEPLYKTLFLNLKADFFRDTKIILNPWCDLEFEDGIRNYIKNIDLPQEIKESISISRSELDGLLI